MNSSPSNIVAVSSTVRTSPTTPTSVVVTLSGEPKNHGVHQQSYREIHMKHDWQVRSASPGPSHADGQSRFAKQSGRRRKRTVTSITKTMNDVHSDHQPQTPSHKTVLLSSSSPVTMPFSDIIQLTQVTPQSRKHPQNVPPRFDTDGQSVKLNQDTMVSTIRKPFAGGAYFEKSPPTAEHNKREKTWLSRPHHPHRSSAGHVKFEANDTVLCKPCHCVLMDAGQQRPAGYPKPVALIAHETKSGPTRSTPSRQHPHTHRPHLWWHHYHSPHDKPGSSSTGSSSLLYTIYGMRPLLPGTHEYSTPWLWNRETGNLTQPVHPEKHRTGFHNHHKMKKNKIQNPNSNEPYDNDQSSSCCLPRSVSPSSRNRRPPRTPNNQTDGPVSETGDSLSHECYPWFQIRKEAHVLQPFRRADYHRVHNRRARASSCSYTLHILTRCHHQAQQTKFRPMYTAILKTSHTFTIKSEYYEQPSLSGLGLLHRPDCRNHGDCTVFTRNQSSPCQS